MTDRAVNDTDPSAGPIGPRHVAVIMDGNGRWATSRGLPRAVGHRRGVDTVKRIVRSAIELSVPFLTLYSFSSENWSRPRDEVDDLMALMKRFIRNDLDELHEAGVRLRVIGERDGVDPELLALVDGATARTAHNVRLDLVIAFNYGSRNEIANAARKLAASVARGEMAADEVTPGRLAAELDTVGIPDPDLLVRTGGEQRLSNFLLWQAAYCELVFVDVHWPDFSHAHFEAAVEDFRRRERRFGGLSAG